MLEVGNIQLNHWCTEHVLRIWEMPTPGDQETRKNLYGLITMISAGDPSNSDLDAWMRALFISFLSRENSVGLRIK